MAKQRRVQFENDTTAIISSKDDAEKDIKDLLKKLRIESENLQKDLKARKVEVEKLKSQNNALQQSLKKVQQDQLSGQKLLKETKSNLRNVTKKNEDQIVH